MKWYQAIIVAILALPATSSITYSTLLSILALLLLDHEEAKNWANRK